MNLKMGMANNKAFRCCCCFHVRTGAIFIGIINLLGFMFMACTLIFASIHPEVLEKSMQTCPVGDTKNQDIVIDVNVKGDQVKLETCGDVMFVQKKFTKDNLCVAFAIVMCMITITGFLLYGIMKNRPGYMMPFFCVQMFDFCISCLTVVGYFSYAPDMKLWLCQEGLACLPLMDRLLAMDRDVLMILCLICFILWLSFKAYLIGVIWACYKYLQLNRVNRDVVREYTVDPDSEMLLPPKYEDAIKVPMDQAPPPPYAS
ncbi:LAPTM [Mytilus coruscus]|uniref:LAPTM n=1 Tax=Mytilus coruscus TaxID=42192 RepID=A0A6J8EI34_MYTCO|nr:LAPTM [Mytilus coruscus]